MSAKPLLEELQRKLESDPDEKNTLIKRIKGIVVFKIDGQEWTLDLREGKGSLVQGSPPSDSDKPDITLTMTADTFVKMVMGKLGSQQAFLMRKLKINGSMALAMKLQPILEAAQPKAKL